MAENHLNYFKNDFTEKIERLKITCWKNSKIISDFHPICYIYLIFRVKIFNFTEAHLIFLSKNSSCLLSLTDMFDIISLDIQQAFLADDRFRFTYQWSDFEQEKLFFWSLKLRNACINMP